MTRSVMPDLLNDSFESVLVGVLNDSLTRVNRFLLVF